MIKCGAGMVDITPKAGTHLAGAGYGEYRGAEIILDPLYAKAVILETDDETICFISLDVTIITEQYCDKIRRSVSTLCDISTDAILVHAIQTHSAPGVGCFMFDPDLPVGLTEDTEFLGGSTRAYAEFASDMAIKAAVQAKETLRPVRVGAGRGFANRLAFNRRAVTRSGKVVMPGIWASESRPNGPDELLCFEGPTDPEVGVLCFRDERMDMVAMLLHFTCHPVNVFSTAKSWHAVSSDWPGAWSKEIRAAFGSSCVPLVLNGCCGNINPWDPFEPDFVADHRRMGKSLFKSTESVIKTMRFHAVDDIRFRSGKIPLDYRTIPDERLAEVNRILREHPAAAFADSDKKATDTAWFLAASTKSVEACRNRWPRFPYEVQAFRIGGTAVVGLPGEPFAEGQLDLKTASKADYLLVAHCASQYVGYLPTRDAYQRGGHEANAECTYWSKLAPGSLEDVVRFAKNMVDGLF